MAECDPTNGVNIDGLDIQMNYEEYTEKLLKVVKRVITNMRDGLLKYCCVLPVLGFNSPKYDLNVIKKTLLSQLIESDKPRVLKRNNKFTAFETRGLLFLDILNFLGGATSLDTFLKAYGASESKGFFPYEWFDHCNKLDFTELPPAEAFYSSLKGYNVLEKDYMDYMNLLNGGKTQEQALKSLKLKEVPKTLAQNYEFLKEIWRTESMTTFKDFLKWYNDKDVLPTVTAVSNMVKFYHDMKCNEINQLGETDRELLTLRPYKSIYSGKILHKNAMGERHIVICSPLAVCQYVSDTHTIRVTRTVLG